MKNGVLRGMPFSFISDFIPTQFLLKKRLLGYKYLFNSFKIL